MTKIVFCYSDALSKALSALYAKLLVVLGLAFPVTEVIAVGVPDGYYQVSKPSFKQLFHYVLVC